jgi:tetratricopeptide (TPR) repeat protein
MNQLTAADEFHLRAAEGWLDLGAYAEIDNELDQVTPANRSHLDVLELRWRAQAHGGRWGDCLALAQEAILQHPAAPWGYIHAARSLHELRQTQQAYAQLQAASSLFPEHPRLFYNLACYSAQLGRLPEARQHFDKAVELSPDPAETCYYAYREPDLAPLFKRPRSICRTAKS